MVLTVDLTLTPHEVEVLISDCTSMLDIYARNSSSEVPRLIARLQELLAARQTIADKADKLKAEAWRREANPH